VGREHVELRAPGERLRGMNCCERKSVPPPCVPAICVSSVTRARAASDSADEVEIQHVERALRFATLARFCIGVMEPSPADRAPRLALQSRSQRLHIPARAALPVVGTNEND